MNIIQRSSEQADTRAPDSRSRFLEAADAIFLTEGYKGASIRKISSLAKTGSAFLARQWPSKAELFRDVFARHFDPIHAEQTRLLDVMQAQGELATPKDIVRAFLLPAFEMNLGVKKMSAAVYCHALIDPDPDAKRIIASLIGDVRQRVINMLKQSLPDADPVRFFAVINIVMGAFVFPQLFGHQLAVAMGFDEGTLDGTDYTEMVATLVCKGIAPTQNA